MQLLLFKGIDDLDDELFGRKKKQEQNISKLSDKFFEKTSGKGTQMSRNPEFAEDSRRVYKKFGQIFKF